MSTTRTAESCTRSFGRWLPEKCRESRGLPGSGSLWKRGGGPCALPLFFRILPLVLAVAPWTSAAAQTVQGQIVDRDSARPVEGVLTLLLNEDGKEVDGALTNASGRFLLHAPAAGTYTIQTDRIGYESVTSDPLALKTGQSLGIRLETAMAAIQLEELRVEGEQECLVRPEEGLRVARVWEEARKALTVQAWTEREGGYRFQVVRYERGLDLDTRKVTREDRRVTTSLSRNPITSLPAEDLMTQGFIRDTEDGGMEYFGPDATVLLSDIFLDTHCFLLKGDDDRPDLIGLAFEPVRKGRLRDIQGTLWLDRSSAALQYLEYGYTWSRYPEAQGVARGRVEFRELPNGAWIVSRWWIRMPVMAQDLFRAGGGRTGIYVAGLWETGGEIAQISSTDRRTVSRLQRGMVSGRVWDSTRSHPLEGARVYLSGTSYYGMTDFQGRFLLEGVPEGVFTAAFTHPRLDTLGVPAPGVDVTVRPGELSEVQLGTPSTSTVLEEACRGQERARSSAVISGMVRDRASGKGIPGATVRLDWQEVARAGAGRLTGQEKWIEVDTDGKGRYTVCGVPPDELLVIQAKLDGRRSDTTQVRVPEESFTVVNLELTTR